jgi:hypothetical protein
VDPTQFVPWFLFAHVLGAIVAFGASFGAFPILGAMTGREPMHASFGARVSDAIAERIVRPFAILQGLTGLGLIWSAQIDLTRALWLDVAIVLYLIALGYALFVQIPNGRRIVQLIPAGPPAAPSGAADATASRPSGPPPELLSAVASARRGGMFLAIMIAVIVFLMVVKPS